jgi:hypothetical protein
VLSVNSPSPLLYTYPDLSFSVPHKIFSANPQSKRDRRAVCIGGRTILAGYLPATRKTASAPQSRGVHGPRVPGLDACGSQPRGSLQRRAGPTHPLADENTNRLHAIASCLCFLPFFLTSRLLRSVTLASQRYATANAAFNSNRNDCSIALKFATAQFQSNFHQKRLLLRLPPALTSIRIIASHCCSVPSRLPYHHLLSTSCSSFCLVCLAVVSIMPRRSTQQSHIPPTSCPNTSFLYVAWLLAMAVLETTLNILTLVPATIFLMFVLPVLDRVIMSAPLPRTMKCTLMRVSSLFFSCCRQPHTNAVSSRYWTCSRNR